MTDDTGDRVFLKTLSRRRAGSFSEKFFLPARVKKVFLKTSVISVTGVTNII